MPFPDQLDDILITLHEMSLNIGSIRYISPPAGHAFYPEDCPHISAFQLKGLKDEMNQGKRVWEIILTSPACLWKDSRPVQW